MDQLKREAYGKINLMLNISGVREDGYHTLETIMQTVGLHDTIEIRKKAKPGIEMTCDLPYIPADERNIAWKAAEKFIAYTGFDGGLEIAIEKTIPVGGGMAGGSTNAATVLNMLNEMCGYPISQRELEAIALTLGADVPFCLKKGTYLCEGIGEVMTRLADLPKCFIVVCKPRASVSSKNAYGVYDQYADQQHFDHTKMVEALRKRDIHAVAAAMGNSFEAPIGELCPEILGIKAKMLQMDALNAAMTGSGSVVFGLYNDANKAHAAKNALRALRYRTYCVKPVNR